METERKRAHRSIVVRRPTVVRTVKAVRQAVQRARSEGKTVGLVPTMGALHRGHLSLIGRSVAQTGFTVVSLFVNPTQFAPGEDLKSYPRPLKRDLALAAEAGANLAFVPGVRAMYPEGFSTHVAVEGLTSQLCGRSRPTHFTGVATVVTKLFNIVGPDRAYVGQKDAQQAFIIKRLAADLDMPVRVVVCPTVREPDGLALSSRNVYLTRTQRAQAPTLHRALLAAKAEIRRGERRAARLKDIMRRMVHTADEARIDYVEIVDVDRLGPIKRLKGRCLLALAVHFGRARLIDNEIVNVT